MKIIICIKQIPDTNDVKWTKDNNIMREGTISVLNPCDINALLFAREFFKNEDVTLLTMGPIGAKEALLEGLSYIGNRAILLSDKKFVGADTLATAKTLAAAIKNVIKEFDLIITGQFASDGDTAQTPYSLGNLLKIPMIGYVNKIEEANENKIVVNSIKDDGSYKLKTRYPALISISGISKKHYTPLISDYMKAQDKEIITLGAEDIGINPDETGIKGSPTYVKQAFRAQNKRQCKFINSFQELIRELK